MFLDAEKSKIEKRNKSLSRRDEVLYSFELELSILMAIVHNRINLEKNSNANSFHSKVKTLIIVYPLLHITML